MLRGILVVLKQSVLSLASLSAQRLIFLRAVSVDVAKVFRALSRLAIIFVHVHGGLAAIVALVRIGVDGEFQLYQVFVDVLLLLRV